uniref:Signal transducer and activator of transcription n=1 Tax=Xenopsylla cheopis TaxID=163159 RepID=A0A6M2DHU1_XENCH
MSLWAKAQQLPIESLQQIQQIYGAHFPIEVRHYLAGWIEEKIWTDIDQDNPQYEQYAQNFVRSLVQELEQRASTLNSDEMFLAKMKLTDAAKMFAQKYYSNPIQLFNYVRHCLTTEMRLVQAGGMTGIESIPLGVFGLNSNSIANEILQELNVLRARTKESGEDLRNMEQEQEKFAISYHNCTKMNANLQHLASLPTKSQQNIEEEKKIRYNKEMLEASLNQMVARLLELRLSLVDKLKGSIDLVDKLQRKVLEDELIRWKREQQLAGNGAAFNSNLDSIQEWCESLAEIIWLNRTQIKEVERLKQKLALDPPGVPDMLPALNSQITQSLSSLVTSTFIIEKQPPQVMKTNTRFTSTVRLLVGGKLNVHMTPPQVKVTIISENQANALLKNDKLGVKANDASGEILNNTGTMEYQQANRQLSVSFRNMQLKKIKRAEKKGTESVMDEKFSLLFQSQFSVGGGELVFQVWTLSLPVVVIVHGNQEPHAWATVTWDNAFAEPGRVPFAVPEKVQWKFVAEALNVKFRAATGRQLTDDNLRFLAEKAFRALQGPSLPDLSNAQLSWAQFCKEPLPDRNFTFWEWFYAVMKLTREHLRSPWIDGSILGFVRKKQAEDMLQRCSSGTFLLRFSDSELGGITIAWVGDGDGVFMLQPFTAKDFTIRTLADRVSDLPHLTYLYPDIDKNTAFGKYYTRFEDNDNKKDGYVRPLLITHVPGFGTPSNTYPNTPQSHYMQSPDPSRDTPSVASSYGGPGTVGTASGSVVNDMDYSNMDYSQQLETLDAQLDLGVLHDLIN